MPHQSADLPANNDGSRVWVPSIVACIARCLPANEIAGTLRLVDKATSQQYENCKTISLSLPSPSHIFKECWGRPESFRGYTRKQRMKLLRLTAASGSIANLEVALASAGLLPKRELLEASAEAGQLDVCKMLRERGLPWGDSLAAAARGGHRHVCEWMLASGCSSCHEAVDAAACSGHEGLMHWLMTHQVVHSADVGSLLRAAAGGLGLAAFQLLMQRFLLLGQRQGGEAPQEEPEVVPVMLEQHHRDRILAAAAGSSTPDWRAKVQWLEGLGYPRTTEACSSAAACSPDEEAVSRLQWLCSRGYTPAAMAAVQAVIHGNLSALRFLVEQAGVRPDRQASDAAARNGDLSLLQYFHTSGLPLEPKTVVELAAGGGHLPVVVWAVEALGVKPGNTNHLSIWAAMSGSVELLTWLRDRGWTWSSATISCAVYSGREEAVEWLVEQGCPWPEEATAAYTEATGARDLAMVRCLHRLSCPWDPNQLVACIRCVLPTPVPVLRCLVELGCPVDWDTAVRAAEEFRPQEVGTELLTWLGEERQRSLGAQQQ